MHFMPGGHWYPESGSVEQNVSGMASELMVSVLFTQSKAKQTTEELKINIFVPLGLSRLISCSLTLRLLYLARNGFLVRQKIERPIDRTVT